MHSAEAFGIMPCTILDKVSLQQRKFTTALILHAGIVTTPKRSPQHLQPFVPAKCPKNIEILRNNLEILERTRCYF